MFIYLLKQSLCEFKQEGGTEFRGKPFFSRPLIDDVGWSCRRTVCRGSLRIVAIWRLESSQTDDLVDNDVAEDRVLDMLAKHVEMRKQFVAVRFVASRVRRVVDVGWKPGAVEEAQVVGHHLRTLIWELDDACSSCGWSLFRGCFDDVGVFRAVLVNGHRLLMWSHVENDGLG